MQISLRHIPVHPMLKGYVEKLWIFESSGRVPDPDMKLIVPNGLIKLVIPYCNGLLGQREGYTRLSKNHQVTLIGVSDVPFIVEAEKDAPAGTIGVEFSPSGAYRFFKLKQSEIKNQIFVLDDVLGKLGREIEALIAEAPCVDEKVALIQSFLLQLFRKSVQDSVFDFCIRRIKASHGIVSVKVLEKETGYSSRWLNRKFEERIGVSPKNLCAINRFQFMYQMLVNDPDAIIRNRAYHNIYYDQAHFIKEFKRFTGMPPVQFSTLTNDFGKIFYKT